MPKTTNAETINWGALQHAPGQYAFINIPEISSLQWHPFSIASSPLDGASTFMIKNMAPGSGQFTDALYQLAQTQRRRHGSADVKAPRENNVEPLVVNVDGPYGNTIFETARYDTVVLVAGGIGITPLHGVLRFLHQLAVAGVGPVRRVHLVWSVRNPALFWSIKETLRSVVENSMGGRFGFALFATRSSANSAVGKSGGGGAMEQGLLDVAQGGVESNQVRLGKQVVGRAGR
jgi:predicted ferric reductase